MFLSVPKKDSHYYQVVSKKLDKNFLDLLSSFSIKMNLLVSRDKNS